MMRQHHGTAMDACFVYGLRPDHTWGDYGPHQGRMMMRAHGGDSHLYPPVAETYVLKNLLLQEEKNYICVTICHWHKYYLAFSTRKEQTDVSGRVEAAS